MFQMQSNKNKLDYLLTKKKPKKHIFVCPRRRQRGIKCSPCPSVFPSVCPSRFWFLEDNLNLHSPFTYVL